MPLPEPLDNPETMREIQARARAYADFIKLPFRNQIWRGQSGDFLGAGVGSSLARRW